MARPDLTAVRTPQILDAFARCVARYGLEGASLEQIAEEAGVKRSLLRHYLGNRDEMIVALAERVVERYRQELEETMRALPGTGANRVGALLDYMFPEGIWEPSVENVVADALLSAVERYPEVGVIMRGFMEEMFEVYEGVFGEGYPEAEKAQVEAVAYGVVSLSFTHEWLMPLGMPVAYARSAKGAAKALVKILAG
ncbi:MAG: TetR/AcrR family transcriptional regulator [Verrucomicrobiota bacterium]